MSLIDRYVYAVTKGMHPNTRRDVAEELRATIEDEVEAKGGRTKKNITAVLTELGNPTVLAHQYKGKKNYLIGPDLYGLFVHILRLILIIVLPILLIVNLVTGFSNGVENIISLIGYALGHTIAGAITITFWVIATFFILERTGVSLRDLEKDRELWTPEKLPEIPGKYRIPVSESITSLVSYLVLIAAPFVAPLLVIAYVGGESIPFFAPDLWAAWTPVIVTAGALGALHSVWMLVAKKWTTLLMLFHVALCVGISVVLALILINTPVINGDFTQLIIENTKDVAASQVEQWVVWTVGISFVITIGIYLFDAGKSVWLWSRQGAGQ